MNIDEIRHLLASYYDGTATAAETDELKRFFNDSKVVPEDLMADACMFRAMAAHKVPAVPPDLRERIIGATVARPRSKILSHWRPILSAAASVALIVSLSLMFVRKNGPAGDEEVPLQARTEVKAANESPDAVMVAEVTPLTTPAHSVTVSHSGVKKAGYREITDSAQVVEITTRLLAKVDATLAKAEKDLHRTTAAIAVLNNPLQAHEISKNM